MRKQPWFIIHLTLTFVQGQGKAKDSGQYTFYADLFAAYEDAYKPSQFTGINNTVLQQTSVSSLLILL